MGKRRQAKQQAKERANDYEPSKWVAEIDGQPNQTSPAQQDASTDKARKDLDERSTASPGGPKSAFGGREETLKEGEGPVVNGKYGWKYQKTATGAMRARNPETGRWVTAKRGGPAEKAIVEELAGGAALAEHPENPSPPSGGGGTVTMGEPTINSDEDVAEALSLEPAAAGTEPVEKAGEREPSFLGDLGETAGRIGVGPLADSPVGAAAGSLGRSTAEAYGDVASSLAGAVRPAVDRVKRTMDVEYARGDALGRRIGEAAQDAWAKAKGYYK